MISGDITKFVAPLRTIVGRVELYNGSTLLDTFNNTDALQSIVVDRAGGTQFFGYGISQKATIKLQDKDRQINIHTDLKLKVFFDDKNVLPAFYVTKVVRDENTNQLTITAHDALYKATAAISSTNLMSFDGPTTLNKIARTAATTLGLTANIHANLLTTIGQIVYEGDVKPNWEGTETIRDVLNDLAEVYGCIYFVNYNDELVFKPLIAGAVLPIDKSSYFTLTAGEGRTLYSIANTTELGDNIKAGEMPETQYIRDNSLLDLRTDRAEIINNLQSEFYGFTMYEFNCAWRGNYLLELGDCISLTTKDNTQINSYLINDTITYNGGYKQVSNWSYKAEEETHTNPSTLGEALTKTFAKVDKIKQEIELTASKTDANTSQLAQLKIDTDSINATVQDIEKNVADANGNIAELTKKVNVAVTPEDLTVEIKKELNNGVSKVETATGFTFNDAGLTVSKSNSEMKTQITEDGMKIYKNDEAVLGVDNVGVNAKNLRATTYLIVGTTSRFEDFNGRTACFWIGG